MTAKMIRAFSLLILFTGSFWGSHAFAHELRPAYLQITEDRAGEFNVVWRVPARGQMKLSLDVGFEGPVSELDSAVGRLANGMYTESWRIRSPTGLSGTTVVVKGLEQTMTDALMRVEWLDGTELVGRLVAENPRYTFTAEPSADGWLKTYFVLGVEHILLGIDHLLFVLVLLLLVSGWRSLAVTISAFTLAHSVTLALSVLGLISVPQAPVEAVIALSIVFVASEILMIRRGNLTLAIRRPWLVALGFGLLHGLGFAGALADIGVSQSAIAGSLLAFNLGVEAGQLLFIAAVASLVVLVRKVLESSNLAEARVGGIGATATMLVVYAIGGTASWWLIDRTVVLVS
ncbi:HupE/UreJ family protein [Microbulbifer bruguierae]|uniref:HupE/UreJ family protein n=1 Tax=Microbulbifer bruguierae TaxID=3029061 RepID=A0ABY8NGA4_9GAMM|nr:HupE/UreJ family protein [Microbulbifer bruguierae]WGL17637.1 HupE/UreJ family protein [Microbulbifer bruguierae]